MCSIHVINSRCDILLDRSVVTHGHGFSRCGHNKLQYTVFCLFTVYLVVSSLYRSDMGVRRGGAKGAVVPPEKSKISKNYMENTK